MNRPKAFSYLRFSTPEQQRGDSFRRQKELAERYATANGLDLDDRSFEDLGVSAFRGKNASAGMLGTFLELFEEGLIPKGTYLLVESLDRLSRATARKALRQLEEMCDQGIVIITLTDAKRYDSDTLDRDPMALMYALVIMMRAHEESAMKSGRLKAAWKSKRNLAREKPVSARVPAWLLLDQSRRTFQVIEPRAAVVRRIYELTLAGVGQHSIAAMFNREGVPTFGSGKLWQRSYIAKILSNPAVIGTFIPHTVDYVDGKRRRIPVEVLEGYYPAVIKREAFERVQAQRLSSRATRSDSALHNLFAGLGRCPRCLSTMTRVNKGNGPKGGKPYLVCVVAKQGGRCDYRAVSQEAVEMVFLAGLADLAREVPSVRTVRGNDLEVINKQLAEQASEVQAIEAEIAREGPSVYRSMRLASRSAICRQLEAERDESVRHLSASAGPTLVPRLRDLLKECRRPDLDRRRVNALLRQLFKGVVMVYDQQKPVSLAFQWHHGGETLILPSAEAA